MIGRRALLALALAAGLLAGGIYLAASRRVVVVVAAHDLDATRALVADDLTTRDFSADAVPDGALDDVGRAVGRLPRMPLVRGQLVLATVLTDRPVAFASGLVAPRGTRAVAIPAGPVQAVGGALTAGSRVDVVSIPAAGRAPAGRPVELLAAGVLVLDVRGESGVALPRPSARPGVAERIGSVVVAVPLADELRVAERIATSTFVLVLAADGARAGSER